MQTVYTSGAFDDIRSADIRFLDEAARLGPLTVGLWPDERIRASTGAGPKFPEAERLYFLESIRFVREVRIEPAPRAGPTDGIEVVRGREAAGRHGVRVIHEDLLREFPAPPPCPDNPPSPRRKVIVTGCFDWFHSGHVRFFEEVSELGDLYVVVGHDANIRLLKGEGHPLLPERERCYVAGAVRYAALAVVSTGDGWLDAEPEVDRLRPEVYAVNEDGDRPEKAAFCARKGIEYRVLRRLPRAGLPRRQSTSLRGF
jgi:cytidyltransferase-like protein